MRVTGKMSKAARSNIAKLDTLAEEGEDEDEEEEDADADADVGQKGTPSFRPLTALNLQGRQNAQRRSSLSDWVRNSTRYIRAFAIQTLNFSICFCALLGSLAQGDKSDRNSSDDNESIFDDMTDVGSALDSDIGSNFGDFDLDTFDEEAYLKEDV